MKKFSLKFKDLFDGRVVYLAIPGRLPAKGRVLGKYHQALHLQYRRPPSIRQQVVIFGDWGDQPMRFNEHDLHSNNSNIRIFAKEKQAVRWANHPKV